jgi:uncharacterized protein
LTRIGLLSDPHGRAAITRRAVASLLAQGVDILLCLGDVGSVQVIDELVVNQPDGGERLAARLVFGNTDMDSVALGRYAQELGVQVDHPAGRLTLDRGVLVFCHGHQASVMDRALAEPVRYLCHGHTHRASDTTLGQTRVINPGALCRAQPYTVAVLDTGTDELTFLKVDGP